MCQTAIETAMRLKSQLGWIPDQIRRRVPARKTFVPLRKRQQGADNRCQDVGLAAGFITREEIHADASQPRDEVEGTDGHSTPMRQRFSDEPGDLRQKHRIETRSKPLVARAVP